MSAPAAEYVPLESGDHLTREEFHRRYLARPDIRKAELIEGIVYVASPVRQAFHGRQHALAMMWLTHYAALVPGLDVGDNATVFLDADNEVQPDAFLFWDPPVGTGARLTEKGYVEGAPPLVFEIAASSAAYDLNDKLRVYRRTGVPEYIVWQVYEGRIDWFRLRNGEYVRIEPDARGIIESEVFPGLRLHVARMLGGDRAGVLAEIKGPTDPRR